MLQSDANTTSSATALSAGSHWLGRGCRERRAPAGVSGEEAPGGQCPARGFLDRRPSGLGAAASSPCSRALATGCGLPDCTLQRRLQIFGRIPPSVGTRQVITPTGRPTRLCRKERRHLGFQSVETEVAGLRSPWSRGPRDAPGGEWRPPPGPLLQLRSPGSASALPRAWLVPCLEVPSPREGWRVGPRVSSGAGGRGQGCKADPREALRGGGAATRLAWLPCP